MVVDADSIHLYYSAKFSQTAPCDPGCPPECDKHGWLDLVAGRAGGVDGAGMGLPAPAGEFSAVPLKIQIKPVELLDFDA